MKFVDAAPISGTRRTGDGYLVTTARSVRTGIQLYAGQEVGRPDLAVVRVYRDAAEVFAPDSLQSFSHAPVTINHPDEAVTADNWKELSAGEVSTAAKQDGEWIMLPLILKDKKAIVEVEQGKRELSAGYTCNLDWTAGTTADGQSYDAQQRDIKINHLALVDRARAGSQARIGDGASWGISPFSSQTADERKSPMADTLRKVLVDGLQVETTDAGATAIEKLTKDKATLADKLTEAEKKAKEAEEENEKKIAKKDAEIDALKGKVLDGAALDAAVQARGDLVVKAKAIAPDVKTDGLSDAAIRKAVVVAKLGDAMADKGDAYIDARFDILAEDAAGTEQLRGAITHIKPVGDAAKVTNDAYSKSVDDLNSWRNQ